MPIPQANSTTSSPRATSPSASECTLPCSETMSAASSSLCWFSSSRNANSTVVRLATDAARQPGNAAAAAATASSTSFTAAKSTDPVTAPVAGSCRSPWRAAAPSHARPSIQWVTCLVMAYP